MSELYRYPVEALHEQRGEMPPLATLCQHTARRIAKSGYLEFGPYWWAVKRILNANGFELGATESALMADRFTIDDDPIVTLIAAWRAADEIRSLYFNGSRDVSLDDDGDEVYSLFDPDMEAM